MAPRPEDDALTESELAEPEVNPDMNCVVQLPKITFVGGVILLLGTVTIENMHEADFNSAPAAFVMQTVISCAVLTASLFVILAKRYSPKDKHWAYATVGTLLGFWLHAK